MGCASSTLGVIDTQGGFFYRGSATARKARPISSASRARECAFAISKLPACRQGDWSVADCGHTLLRRSTGASTAIACKLDGNPCLDDGDFFEIKILAFEKISSDDRAQQKKVGGHRR